MTEPRKQDESRAVLFASREVSFAAGDRVILHPLDIVLPEGQVYGLVGHNGSGKSTLLKLLARQTTPTKGQISLANTPLQDWAARDFARHVAYLPQDTPPAPGLTVEDLVAHGRYPWHGAFRRFSDQDRKKVAEAMTLTGVDGMRSRLVDTLSGGERQRAWIAMLVAQDARCLLLDEPISALDVAHQIEILSLIRNLSHQKSLSVVVVLHDVNMAARFCDRILALKQGRLVADGMPDNLLTRDALADIFGLSMGVIPHPGGQGMLAYVD